MRPHVAALCVYPRGADIADEGQRPRRPSGPTRELAGRCTAPRVRRSGAARQSVARSVHNRSDAATRARRHRNRRILIRRAADSIARPPDRVVRRSRERVRSDIMTTRYASGATCSTTVATPIRWAVCAQIAGYRDVGDRRLTHAADELQDQAGTGGLACRAGRNRGPAGATRHARRSPDRRVGPGDRHLRRVAGSVCGRTRRLRSRRAASASCAAVAGRHAGARGVERGR